MTNLHDVQFIYHALKFLTLSKVRKEYKRVQTEKKVEHQFHPAFRANSETSTNAKK